MKRILLISHNFAPEPTGIGKYNGEMMDWFAKNGYDCTVITTYPYYPYWKVQPPYKNRWYKKEVNNYAESNTSITVYRCPSYVPANPTGKKRLLQDLSFWTSKIWVLFKLIVLREKYDLIITVAPPFHLAYLGIIFRKLNGGKLVYHVQDLQIEAAQDLNMLSNEKFFDKIYKVEKNILDSADYVSSISEGMIEKIKGKVSKEILFFPNWADTSLFFPLNQRETLKTRWGYKEDDIIYLYSGAIGEKQGLESIINVAAKLKHLEKVKFIICGSGPYKEKLIEYANSKKLDNISFLPVQVKEKFNEFLNMADFHLILQKANAGDLVMPSKLTTILAVGGISIVTAIPGTSLFNLIEKYDVGINVEAENDSALTQIISNIKLDNQIDHKRINARNYSLKFLNIDEIMKDFLKQVLA